MPLHFFSIPALRPEPAQAELNAFLAAHRVVGLEKQWLAAGADSHWCLCVAIADGPEPLPEAARAGGKSRAKVDYREVLSAEAFAVYAELRAVRKHLAESEGVPPYAVFTNEQLAEMVRRKATSAQALREIDGIGEARVAKYAPAFLPVLQGSLSGAGAAP